MNIKPKRDRPPKLTSYASGSYKNYQAHKTPCQLQIKTQNKTGTAKIVTLCIQQKQLITRSQQDIPSNSLLVL